jgi:hypothetical protein
MNATAQNNVTTPSFEVLDTGTNDRAYCRARNNERRRAAGFDSKV